MKSKSFTTDKIDKDDARKAALNYVDNILSFVEPINDNRPALGFQRIVLLLKEMRERIENSSPPFRSSNEVKSYLIPVQQAVVRFLPPITKNLDSFWRAQNRIIEESNKSKTAYTPADIIEMSHNIITDINNRFEIVLSRFVANPKDEVNIDALFYMHILRTETLAKALREQLTRLLDKYCIEGFDPAAIYSIEPPIKQQKRGDVKYLTDAEAIRNALAHNKYVISTVGQTWQIEFDNKGEYGYHYKKNFTQNTLEEYLKQLEILYKATLILMNLLTVWGIVTNSLLEKHDTKV